MRPDLCNGPAKFHTGERDVSVACWAPNPVGRVRLPALPASSEAKENPMKTLATLVIGVLIGWATSGLLDHVAVWVRTHWR